MTKQKIRVALVGSGVWGRQDARIFNAREDVEFCAIGGRTSERVAARAAEYGVRAYLDMLCHGEKKLTDVSFKNVYIRPLQS